MSAPATVLHFDKRNNCFRALHRGGVKVDRIAIPRRQTHYLRVAMFEANDFDQVKLDIDGTIAAPGNLLYSRPNISDQTSLVIGVKPRTLWESTAYETSFTGFVSDSDWDGQTVGGFTGSVLLPKSVAEGDNHLLELMLVNSSAARWYLPQIVLDVQQDLNTGTETDAPSGLPGGQSGDTSIADSDLSTTVTVTGLTSTGHVNIQVLTPTGSPGDVFPVISYATGSFTITSSSAPGTGNAWNFRWTLDRLS